MKQLFFIFLFLTSSFSFGQHLKINQADYYFKNYRFSESTPIYKELISKNQIKIETNLGDFRKAYQSAIRSKDLNFANEVLTKLSTSNQLNFDDLYVYFNTLIYIGNYNKALELLERDVFLNSTDSRKTLMMNYNLNKLQLIQADSTKYNVQVSQINSNKGDFGLNYHPKGYYYSSAKDLASNKWSYDNSYI